ncbi:hypothetical protein E3N88_14849 [Mikania micrantha]|uniref:Uncharacterized protein n=1 Tax=Mikania micrantha TaxID=192012 RepID=A0A5N6P2Q0_9ASTR|nr:hypothetical protein E3N88_14849 [Mikania micrantha]
MADQGERYIYQRFPYVILDDTPSSSSGSDSDLSEASAAASQAAPPVPQTPPAPVPATPPLPASPVSSRHSQLPVENAPADRRQSASPPRIPVRDGLRRMRGQARKTTGLPPRHQLAPRDVPTTVHEVGESSHQASYGRNCSRVAVEDRLSRTLGQMVMAAFWQQVAVLRERVVWMRGVLMGVLAGMSLEARLLCDGCILATSDGVEREGCVDERSVDGSISGDELRGQATLCVYKAGHYGYCVGLLTVLYAVMVIEGVSD